jgi:hypothetical protein
MARKISLVRDGFGATICWRISLNGRIKPHCAGEFRLLSRAEL